ncbi:Fic family protein [Roseivivax sediminis]|uniref:Fic/DOC family protein n=1 Tax=Roseivivax sediminis TaxID=936889 RepID=A0A1I1UA69_9RHOB|nr:Fic family protein [Roseivivax sediminis]SFD67761.1 Fic/DOC family protein [Roseivivax sediminis]
MDEHDDGVRHSQAESAAIVSNPDERARLEAANALKQAQLVQDMVMSGIERSPFKLRPSKVLDLNRCAIQGLDAYAGNWRPGDVEIGKSKHQPPGAHLVPELVEEMCDYVNDNWARRNSIHLASFVMWRLNWIHPFTDGNGRTSRAVSYLVLSVHAGAVFPGRQTIPEQVVANRKPYYDALESADAKFSESEGFPDDIVSGMEDLMSAMLAKQLKGAFDSATE